MVSIRFLIMSFISLFFNVIEAEIVNSLEKSNSIVREKLPKFQPIYSLLEKYQRPITVLVSGLSVDEYQLAFDIASTYESTVVILESVKYQELNEQCMREQHKNIILLTKKPEFSTLKHLSECDHFDVVIFGGRSFLFNTVEVKRFIHSMICLGDHIFTIIPRDIVRSSLVGSLKKRVNVMARENHEQLWYLRGNRHSLTHTVWWRRKKLDNNFKIYGNFQEKIFVKIKGDKVIITPWKRGINLATYKVLQGIYPPCNIVSERILGMNSSNHHDWAPHNMIIQGYDVEFIDVEDAGWVWPEEYFLKFMASKTSKEVLSYVSHLSKQQCKKMKGS